MYISCKVVNLVYSLHQITVNIYTNSKKVICAQFAKMTNLIFQANVEGCVKISLNQTDVKFIKFENSKAMKI